MNAAARKTPEPGDDAQDAPPWLSADGLTDDDELQGDRDALLDHDAGPIETGTRPCAAAASERQFADWIDAIVGQDERALAALYDATFSRVFGLVRRIVRDAAMAEEVVEDAYFQVWRQAARFDPARGKALTWLLSIARSRAIDALRRDARFRHDGLDDDACAQIASPLPDADELLDMARHRSDLQQALMMLGAQPRQLVSLAFFRGLSHEEIALQTRLPLGTVKSQIRRALLSLQQILGGNGGAPALAS